MLSKNSDRYCQHPYFVMTSEPKIMSSTGTTKLGYHTMHLNGQRRAKSNYSAFRKGKKQRKRRLMTAGHGGRKRSAVGQVHRANRPITAKGPGIGRFGQHTKDQVASGDKATRPETVPFTNLGPLGETEPIDEENEKLQQEINREVTGESEKEIEDRIHNNETPSQNDKEESENRREDKYDEPEKHVDNLTDDLSNPPEKKHTETSHDGDEHESNNNIKKKDSSKIPLDDSYKNKNKKESKSSSSSSSSDDK